MRRCLCSLSCISLIESQTETDLVSKSKPEVFTLTRVFHVCKDQKRRGKEKECSDPLRKDTSKRSQTYRKKELEVPILCTSTWEEIV